MHISRVLSRCLVVCACLPLAVAKDKPEKMANPLLKLASDRALFLPNPDSPFKVLLEFDVHGRGSSPLKGKFSWMVTPTGDSRKETLMSDYHDLQVLKGSTLWTVRTLDFMPLQAAWMEYAMTNFRLINSGFPVERYFKTSEHHEELQCIELMQGKNPRTLCFSGEGNLRKVEFHDLKLTYEYSDYRPLASKFAPYRITAKSDSGTVVEAEVASIAPATATDEQAIAHPDNAVQTSSCLAPTLPTVNKSVPAVYPEQARRSKQQGEVIFWVHITGNGNLAHEAVVQTASKLLDDAVLAAAPKWKYEPARCQNTPVESDALVPVSFTLEIH